MNRFPTRSGIFALLIAGPLLLSGCNVFCPINGSCKKDGGGGGESVADTDNVPHPGSQPVPPVNGGVVPTGGTAVPTAPTETVTHSTSPAGFALTRLAPEQLSNNLNKALGYDNYRYENTYLGTSDDFLLDTFAVGLGGIDFVSTSFRDTSTKAQTLLIARVIAWQAAKHTTTNDYWAIWDTSRVKKVFSIVHMDQDDPVADRWQNQAKDLFWRLYARPATGAELGALASTFNAVKTAEAAHPESDRRMRAWMAILYAMLASQEFWHI